MANADFPPGDLTKEKSLWDIYVASRSIPGSRFNRIATIVFLVVLVFDSIYGAKSTSDVVDAIREHAEIGLDIALSTLGFLIAGFTIFATMSQPSLLLAMSEVRHPKSALSYLKHNLFVFVRAFIYYLLFCFLCVLILAFGGNGGVVARIVEAAPYSACLKYALVKLAYIFLYGGFFVLLIQLKSFVFNVYHSVMTALRWRAGDFE